MEEEDKNYPELRDVISGKQRGLKLQKGSIKIFCRCERQRMPGGPERCPGQSLHHDSGGKVHGRGPDGVRDHPQGRVH